ncbi:MAG TPA: glycosyltransferase family 1 protein [Humibacillus sp.]|nr:glycosyltransferase family 1 protein [Humibacillus sp.]
MPPVRHTSALRVLAIPSAHPYSERLRSTDPGTSHVVHLDDPVVPGAPAGQWWPPTALDADWVHRHAGEVDVVHLHFGFDAASPADLRRWVHALREEGIPLVLTAHDLVNPHFTDQTEHRARLDVLVPAADALITLTAGAATEIEQRWGRSAEVLAHPHVAPLDVVGAPRPDREGAGRPFVVGIDLKSLRANVVAEPVVRIVSEAVATLPHAQLVVDVHRDVLDPSHPRHDRFLLQTLADLDQRGRLRVDVHDRRSDEELWEHLRGLDLAVLPYAFGTHSGWVEACYDLGTTVLAPRTGHWVEQEPMLTFGWRAGDDPDEGQVFSAVQLAFWDRPPWQANAMDRAAQQVALSDRHEQLYAALLGRPTTATMGVDRSLQLGVRERCGAP